MPDSRNFKAGPRVCTHTHIHTCLNLCMFFRITYARYAYNCSMTQFIVAADELPNAQPNPRLELRMEMEMELGLWLGLGRGTAVVIVVVGYPRGRGSARKVWHSQMKWNALIWLNSSLDMRGGHFNWQTRRQEEQEQEQQPRRVQQSIARSDLPIAFSLYWNGQILVQVST